MAVGPGDLRFEIVGRDSPTPAMRVSFSGRTDDMPLTAEELQALDAYIEEHGTIQLTEAQVQEFQLRVQSTIDSMDSSTPCSPEDFDACYDQSVEECEGGTVSGGIGGGIARLAAPTGPGGILATAAGIVVMNWVTCNAAVYTGCDYACGTRGPTCYPSGNCYAVCPENTQPAYSSCAINGVPGQCCSWNGPNPGEDNCVPPALCYDDYCWGCPPGTVEGPGDCRGNNGGGGCGACCIPEHP